MKVGKKLVKYAMEYRKFIIIALLMLTFSVGAELTGPFIAKKMIDSHVLGIESPWFETVKGKDTVLYEGKYYKRSQYFRTDEQKGKEVRIIQVGKGFYFINGAIQMDGERSYIKEK